MDTDLEVELGGIFLHNGSYNYDSDYAFEDELEPRGAEAVFFPLLFSIVLAIGVPGNALVLVFLCLKRLKCWRVSDIFILHLGISDVLLLVTLPFWAAQVAQPLGWCCGLFWCRINGAVFNISFYSGMFLLLCITAERYLSIIHSLRLFTPKTPRLAHITCVLVWIISFLLGIPDLFSLIYIEEHNVYGDKTCSCVANIYKSKWLVPSRIIHHISFFLPVVALIVFIYYILMRLRESPKACDKLRTVMLILTLVLSFLLCWTPYNIALIIDTRKRHSKTEKTALLATLAVACVHACLRPLLYLALCKKFQKKTLGMVRCRKEECEEDLWELGVGTEDVTEQSVNPEEMKQMNNSVEQQLQSGQC